MSTPVAHELAPVTRVIVHGARGRMGSRLCELASADARFAVVGKVGRRASADARETTTGGENALKTAVSADVVIDFSSDAGVLDALELAHRCGAALLVGTTGLAPATLGTLRESAGKLAVLVAPNTSLGVAVLARIAADAASALGSGYDCSIVESHHRRKKDAPSGTALRLAGGLREAGAVLEPGRIHSVRGGDVIGEHTIRFDGPGESIELTHRAVSRDLFVLGALRAAHWLRGRERGWWTIDDALGLGGR